MIIVSLCKCPEVTDLRIERSGSGIWVYYNSGYFLATPDDWREIIKQVSALLPPEKVEAAPDPRGYVFIDRDGDTWGYWSPSKGLSYSICGRAADRPFHSREEAQLAGEKCKHGCIRVEVWTPECGVPPMPEDAP